MFIRDILPPMNKICWVLTPKCNYDCWFCRRHFNDIPEPSKDTIDKIIEFINSIAIKIPLKIKLTGGEPTISPYFFEVLNRLKCYKLSLSTNLSQNISFLSKLQNYNVDSMIISYHSDFITGKDFFNKLVFLIDNKITSNIYINFTFEKNDYDYIMENYFEIFKMIDKNFKNLVFYLIPHNEHKLEERKLTKIFKCMSNSNKSIYSPHYISQKGNYVDCFNKFLTINWDGKAYLCQSCLTQQNIYIDPLFDVLDKRSLNIYELLKINKKLFCECDWCCHKFDE